MAEAYAIAEDTIQDICMNCLHKDVCKYKDILKDLKLESSLDLREIENPFSLSLSCELRKIMTRTK